MKKTQAAKPARQEPDERVERSKKAVLAATHELLTKSGLGGVSVDEVSRRSGVAKTTIYRHWPSRSELVIDACSQIGSKPQAPETGKLKDDLEILAVQAAKRLHAPWAAILPSIIDAAERDPELAELHARLHGQITGAFRTAIEQAQQRGEIARSQDTAEMVAALLGPLFYRRWFSREPLDEAFVRGVVQRVLASAMPRKR